MRVGIVGYGRIGAAHAANIARVKGVRVTAVCEPNAELAQKVKTDWGFPVWDNLSTFLKEAPVDWVVLATPSHLHYAQTLQILKAGVDVMVEKPMAETLTKAKAMAAAAKKCKRKLTVNQTRRFWPELVYIKKILDQKKLGTIKQIYMGCAEFNIRDDWQVWKKFGGGQLANLGVHMADAVLYLMGKKPVSVYGRLDQVRNKGDAEDTMKFLINFNDGSVGEVEHTKSYHSKPMWHIVGTKGSIKVDYTRPKVQVEVSIETKRGRKDTVHEVDYSTEENQHNQAPHWAALHKALKRKGSVPVSVDSVLRTTAVLDAVRKSHQQKKVVQLSKTI